MEWTNDASECCLSDTVVRLQTLGGDGGVGGVKRGRRRRRRMRRHFFLSVQRTQFKMQQQINENLRKPMPHYQFIVTGNHSLTHNVAKWLGGLSSNLLF